MRYILSILFLCVVLAVSAQPYQRLATPYEFFKIKVSQSLILPDTSLALGAGDTGRVAIVGQNLYISYLDVSVIKWRAVTGEGSGTVFSVTAGTFLIGGTITGSGTIALDTASTALKAYIAQYGGGGGAIDTTVLNFDLPSFYVIPNDDTVDINLAQYLLDSIKIIKNGDSLFFPSGDTAILADVGSYITNQYALKESKSASFQRLNLDSIKVGGTVQKGIASFGAGGDTTVNLLADGRIQAGMFDIANKDLHSFRWTLRKSTGSNQYLIRSWFTANMETAGEYTNGYGGLLGQTTLKADIPGVSYELGQGVYGYAVQEGQAKVDILTGGRFVSRADGTDTAFRPMGAMFTTEGDAPTEEVFGINVFRSGMTNARINYGAYFGNQSGVASEKNFSFYSDGGIGYVKDSFALRTETPIAAFSQKGGDLAYEAEGNGEGFELWRYNIGGSTLLGGLKQDVAASTNVATLYGVASRPLTVTNSGSNANLMQWMTNIGIVSTAVSKDNEFSVGRRDLFPAKLNAFYTASKDAFWVGDSSYTTMAIKVNKSGDVKLLDSNWTFLNSNKYLGYGTQSPESPLHIIGGTTSLMIESSTATPGIRMRRSVSGSAVTIGTSLGRFNVSPYDGSSYATTTGQWLFVAEQSHTTTAKGTYAVLQLIPNDSTSIKNVMGFNSLGQGVVGQTLNYPASSRLSVYDTTRGVLFAPMTRSQMLAISSPAHGLEVYNTSDSAKYHYRGTNWSREGDVYVKKSQGQGSALLVSSTAAETFSTFNIPANMLRSGSVIEIDYSAIYINNSAGAAILRAVFQSGAGSETNIIQTGSLTQSASQRLIFGKIIIVVDGSTLRISSTMHVSGATGSDLSSIASSLAGLVNYSITLTDSNNFNLKFQSTVADSNISITPFNVIIKVKE